MRISVEFLTHDEVELPWDYLDHLRGLFYQTMALGRPKLAQQVHEQGFGTASKHYKLATFSLLYPDEYRKMKHGMRVRGRLRWWIASPLEPVIEAIALGFLTRRKYAWANVCCRWDKSAWLCHLRFNRR
jgi:CRISPR/Cas system endoribonuclease Cas6 (RAMP superfamily)